MLHVIRVLGLLSRSLPHVTGVLVLLSCSLYQPVGLNNGFALLFCQLANRLQVFVKCDFVVIEGFLQDTHAVLERGDFTVELHQLLRKWVRGVDVIIKVIGIDRRGILTFTDHFLHVFVLLLDSRDVSINRGLLGAG